MCLRVSCSPSLFPLVSHDLFAQKLKLGVGIPRGQTRSVFLWALPHRTPTPAKFRPTVGTPGGSRDGDRAGRGIVCLGSCRGQSLTWVRLFSSRKGGNGSAKGSAWPRSPGEEVSGRRDSNPRPSEPRASRNPSPRGEAKGRQHSRAREIVRDKETRETEIARPRSHLARPESQRQSQTQRHRDTDK